MPSQGYMFPEISSSAIAIQRPSSLGGEVIQLVVPGDTFDLQPRKLKDIAWIKDIREADMRYLP